MECFYFKMANHRHLHLRYCQSQTRCAFLLPLQEQNWQQVLDYWEPLLLQLPETADDRQRIQEAVEEARQQLLASASD